MADRLSVDKRYEAEVIDKVDDLQFLGLDSSTSERIDLFMFALGLGSETGIRTPLVSKKGLILESVVSKRTEAYAMLYSLFIEELRRENEEEKIDDKDLAFTVAEEYANTGFKIMASWFKDDVPNVYKFVKEMDAKYDQYFEER